jgi:rhamnosyltransferase
MKRIILFAHYDRNSEVKPYVLRMLQSLCDLSGDIVFVSTCQLPDCEVEKLRPFAMSVVLRENTGFDFAMWQHTFRMIDTSNYDELVLANSSVFGPIYPLAPIFERMANDPCDFWGMTDSFMIRWHLQSYFLVFKRKALCSVALRTFLDSVLPYRDKFQLIRSYEIGLATYLSENGLYPGTFAPVSSWLKSPSKAARMRRARQNPTLRYARELLELGMPFVKVALLRDNPERVPLGPVLRIMREERYDMSLIQFDSQSPSHKSIKETLLRAFSHVDSKLEAEFPRALQGSSGLPQLEH